MADVSDIVDTAKALAARLNDADVLAGIDPAWADVNRPCVLIAPPSLDYSERSATWRVVALSSHAAGTLAALEQLAGLVDDVAGVLDVEAAEPSSYVLSQTSIVPAYLIRVTTSH